MYIGIDVDAHYIIRRKKGLHIQTRLLRYSHDVREFIEEVSKLDREDFLEGRVIHRMTNVDKKISSRDELIEELYKYMFYVHKGFSGNSS